jgi:putative transposase
MQGASMARSRYKFQTNEYPYFLTDTIVGWRPLLRESSIVDIILNSFRFLQEHSRILLFGYVIMPTHMHYIAAAKNLSKEVGALKSFTASQVIKLLESEDGYFELSLLSNLKVRYKNDRTHQLWQEGSHPQVLPTRNMMKQKLSYIHNNPVKAGLVNDPIKWIYSSASNYAGLGGVLEVETRW